jgi:hypothetical protein
MTKYIPGLLRQLPQAFTHSLLPSTTLTSSIKPSSAFLSAPIRNFTYTFLPRFETVANIPATASQEELAKEKSMYSATTEFVQQHGGPISKNILATIPANYYQTAQRLGLYPNIDIRVHRFDKSFLNVEGLELYPAIPGLHCDGEFRETYFGQPDLDRVPVSYHLIATVASKEAISRPRFVVNPVTVDVQGNSFAQDVTLWEKVHNAAMKIPDLRYYDMPDGALTQFDARSLHEVTPVKFTGSRMFFRCSMWHKPNLDDGQLSTTEQLYTVFDPLKVPKSHNDTTVNVNLASDHEVVSKVNSTYSIGELAKEQGVLRATLPFIQKQGGPILRALTAALPEGFLNVAKQLRKIPVVDFLIYRPYVSYIANTPANDGGIRLSGWNLPVEKARISSPPTPEVLISVSSHPQSVSSTELLVTPKTSVAVPDTPKEPHFWHHFNQKLTSSVQPQSTLPLKDGDVVLTSSHTPRRETATTNRGWRAILRASLVDESTSKPNKFTDQLVKQQYMQVPYIAKGW